MSKHCPLCHSQEIKQLPDSPAQMDFWGCKQCGLLYKDHSHHLSVEAEKQRYLLHQNQSDSAGYVQFLSPVVELVRELGLSKGALGLDFGCGPGPVLAELLRSDGYEMKVYDPHFFSELSVSPGSLDFLVCTEAAEHFFSPRREVELMGSLIKPGAPVVWMTSLWRDEQDFADWYYIKDPTHVSIYTEQTAKWIGDFWGKTTLFSGKNLIWWV